MRPTVEKQFSLVKDASKACGWHQIDWEKAHQHVKRLQTRIVKATKAGKHRKVQSLQWVLTHSFYAKALAVKRVTENAGKKTAGIDQQLWNTPKAKYDAISQLSQWNYQPSPLRRVVIPKSNGKTRNLGIPTMIDRAMQALHLQALAPIAETTADPNSYGFREARSCHDAIEQCFNTLSNKNYATWVLEADIKSCFDRMSHQWIRQHIPMNKKVLSKWLKMGVMVDKTFSETTEGVPQGGIISPTIANMVLDGLEATILNKLKPHKYRNPHKINFIRYADDWVVTANSKEILETQVIPCAKAFLLERGLELSPTKTKITHINQGFDFLGQNVRKYNGKLLIKPSTKSVKSIKVKIKETIKSHQTAKALDLIIKLNPILRGWANYHQHIVSKEIFHEVHYYLINRLWQWAKRRHPRKNKHWIKEKYFKTVNGDNWVFFWSGGNATYTIFRMSRVKIKRHIKVKKEANPYDPQWNEYFQKRRHKEMLNVFYTEKLRQLWRSQKGLCPVCSAYITQATGWHTHHITPRSKGGEDTLDNLVMLHPNCHRQVHSQQLEVTKP